MKAVVVEINNNQAAILSDDGCITSIKNANYSIGQEVQLNKQKSTIVKKLSVFVASAAACMVLGVSTWAYASPYIYVSVDVNPSLEFVVNRFDRVIRVNGVNDDGEEILTAISLRDLKNKKIEFAIKSSVQQITEAGYFEGNTTNGIVITTSSEDTDKADELAQELQKTIIQETVETGDSVVVESFSVGLDRVEEAKELGVTPGKLNLVEKLQDTAEDPTAIDLEEWLNKPVKEIMKAMKDFKKSDKEKVDAQAATSDEIVVTEVPEQENQVGENDATQDKKNKSDKEKAIKQAEKDAEKAQKEAAKAEEDAKEAQENSDKKAKEAAKEYNAAAKEAAKLAAKEAEKKAKKAQDSAKDAQKAATEAQNKVDKAKKDARSSTNTTQDSPNQNNKNQNNKDQNGNKNNSNPDHDNQNKDSSNIGSNNSNSNNIDNPNKHNTADDNSGAENQPSNNSGNSNDHSNSEGKGSN